MAELGILEYRTESLPEKEKEDFVRWLAKPEAKILTRIIESRIREQLSEGMKAALVARDDPLKIEATNGWLASAHRYARFLDVWNELRQQTKFTTAKWQNPT